MDAEYFEQKLDKSDIKPKKTSAPTPNAAALKAITQYTIFFEVDDYIIAENVVRDLKLPIHLVVAALNSLCKQGILHSEVMRADKDDFERVGDRNVKWNGSAWVFPRSVPTCRYELHMPKNASYEEQSVVYRKYGKEAASSKELAVWKKKNPEIDSGWNGRIFRILAGSPKYAKMRTSAGLSTNPFAEWDCKCGRHNEFGSKSCGKCHRESPHRTDRSRPPSADKPQKETPTCRRCGIELKNRRRHSRKLTMEHGLRECNDFLVRGIMEM